MSQNTKKRGRPRKFATATELRKKITAYFKERDRKGKPYTVCGLALALGLDRKALIEYAQQPEFSNTIKKAKLRIEAQLEERLMDKAFSTPGVIFNLKNNFGWRDEQKIDLGQQPIHFTIKIHGNGNGSSDV